MPFARNTMFVEVHWSALKRGYLIYHNRPRIGFLLYIIDVKLMPRFLGLFEMLRDGKLNPGWYKQLRKEWDKKRERVFSGAPYTTDLKRWTCSCGSFYMSKFLICKHLIANGQLPFCRDLVRNAQPPFWEFKRESNCRHPIVEQSTQGNSVNAESIAFPDD